jgi:DNA polymerase I-like protein with 3'-5' exonuclease and polymerase domains
VGFCDGCNSYFQGLTADGAKAALYEVVRECYLVKSSPLYGFRPVAFIHDEILLEGPEAGARAAAKRLEEVMISEMQEWTPNIPTKADAHLMLKWYKDAEPVYDKEGQLQVWEP